MKIKNHKGKTVDAFIEVIKERWNGRVTVSDIREPTKIEIKRLKNKKCNHKEQSIQLVTDKHGWIFDHRSCVICGMCLGNV